MEIAYATQAKVRDMSKVQCYSCKEYGHIANHCKKKFCNYCKKSGHLIVECRRRPQNRTSQALHVSHSSSAPGFDSGSISRPDSSSGMTNLTPEVMQQLIYSALSTLGISGTSTHSHVCYIDSGASNHMVSSPKSLVNVKPSLGNLEIQTANGDKLPVKAIGDIPHSLPLNNVFLVPHLTSNLLSMGQLVDENCKVEALSTSIHLINRLPSPVLDNETPYFRLYGHNPDYNHLRVFGCLCYAHLPSSDRNKLTAQSARYAFLGYASDRKGQCDVSNMPDAPPLQRSARHIKPPNRLSLMAALSVTNTADILTKALTKIRHQFLVGKLMLLDSPASI
ncbi:hypothetical protein FEM48_Zijuj01G0133800 [Ziziphus jujuba var. spinosa]|uniref:CCHC-type domain-containing protein n=1 Tax=Ziziphus jujuba var. spinosa TaxID=714518 RepID=A0A978W1I0_ZIZJJ|nr:hypothetical protein FEM48_Zijuj01G0133800 [Ziziphus jujuba var. spinosa]